jgi:hypothetical protein
MNRFNVLGTHFDSFNCEANWLKRHNILIGRLEWLSAICSFRGRNTTMEERKRAVRPKWRSGGDSQAEPDTSARGHLADRTFVPI